MNASPPLVSIVIPAYNAAPWLGMTVSSIFGQTMAHWELVIVNDGSTDATPTIADQLAGMEHRIKVLHQVNGGLCQARNAGYRLTDARSPYIIFLDADDLWENDALELLITELEAHPNCHASYGLARYIDFQGTLIQEGELEKYHRERWGVKDGKIFLWPDGEPTSFGVFALGDRITSVGAVMLRRSILDKVGTFTEELKFWEDWDLWLRICQQGPMHFFDKPILRYRRHTTNLSSNLKVVAEYYNVLRERMETMFPRGSIHAKMAKQGASLHRKFHAHRYLAEASRQLKKGQLFGALKDGARAGRETIRLIGGR